MPGTATASGAACRAHGGGRMPDPSTDTGSTNPRLNAALFYATELGSSVALSWWTDIGRDCARSAKRGRGKSVTHLIAYAQMVTGKTPACRPHSGGS